MRPGASRILGPVTTRRDLLLAALPAVLAPAVGFARRKTVSRTRPGGRYFVQILLEGGLDAVMSTDPKVPAEVESGVDIPFEEKAILSAGSLRLGPLLKPLAPFASRMALLNGVLRGIANHPAGRDTFWRCKGRVTKKAPTLTEIVATVRDGQPLGALTGDDVMQLHHLFAREDSENFRELASAARFHARANTPNDPFAAAAALFDRLPSATRFIVGRHEGRFSGVFHQLDRTAWLIENDLASAFGINAGQSEEPFDSHNHNTKTQITISEEILPAVARFLTQLSQRRNAHGNLLDNTTVLLGSELGRFPYLNGWRGKDHFPEAPFIVLGAAIERGGTAWGATGRRMEALPISFADGKPDRSGRRPHLEDVGSTLLGWYGFSDPSVFGYGGDPLRFLGRS
jgi:hypothetical protein